MKSPVAPQEGIDWLFAACVVLIVATFIGDVVTPAFTLRPLIEAAAAMAEEEPSAVAIPSPPSLAWPILCSIAGSLVVAAAAWRLIEQREVSGRWLWMLAAGASAALWSLLTVAALAKAHAIVARAISHL